MSEKISRRDFLKLAAAGAATTVVLTDCAPVVRFFTPATQIPMTDIPIPSDDENLSPEQVKQYGEILDIYSSHGVNHSKILDLVMSQSRSTETPPYDAGEVVLEIPKSHINQATAAITVAYALMQDEGTVYLNKITTNENCTCAGSQTMYFHKNSLDWDTSSRSAEDLQKIYGLDAYTAEHEMFHLLDTTLSSSLNTKDENLALGLIRAKLIYMFGLTNIYSHMQHSNMLGQPFHNLGLHVYENIGMYQIQNPTGEWAKIQEAIPQAVGDTEKMELGQMIFELKEKNRELILPNGLDELFSNNFFPSVSNEVFAELCAGIIAKIGLVAQSMPEISENADAIELLENYLSILRFGAKTNQHISINDVRDAIYNQNTTLPYKVVEPVTSP